MYFSFENYRRMKTEKNIINVLVVFHDEMNKYFMEKEIFPVGAFDKKKLCEILGLNLKEEKEIAYEYYSLGGRNYSITGTYHYIENSMSFTLDDYSIRVNDNPVDLKSMPSNPCCVSSGGCPTLKGCMLGK